MGKRVAWGLLARAPLASERRPGVGSACYGCDRWEQGYAYAAIREHLSPKP